MNSNTYLTSYQRMEGNDFDEEIDPDPLIHVVPKSDKTRWNHIEDLDNFFIGIYQYHQDSGFWCMVVKEVGYIVIVIFTVFLSIFLYTDIDYEILFKNKLPPGYDDTKKIKISDCLRTPQEAWEYFDPFLVTCIGLSFAFLLFKIVWFAVNFRRLRITKQFYNEALGIEDHNLENVTWEEVQRRLMEVQVEQRMCIHKESLTELDIYHRILRYENYFIAMVNKNIIPLKYKVLFFGEVVFLSRTLHFLLKFILFDFTLVAAFKNWQLKEEYKRTENRHELAESLSKKFFWVGLISFIISPFVLLMQLLHSVYHYTAFVKTDPSILGIRIWSNYGKVSLRHYNELDHELKARLSRGYRVASQYMNSFSSPLVANLAAPLYYISGAIAAVTIILTVIDEDVLQVEHVITITTAMIGATALLRSLVPSENVVWYPELLMTKILSEVHYLPDSWKGRAHTSSVRKEFSRYFQYTFSHLLESLLSPVVTPLILIFKMEKKSLEIVDFLRNFTVEVPGVGDICSFAQMDIGKHGSRTWHPVKTNVESTSRSEYSPPNVTDNGKTELSLLHFTLTNPNWKPPQDSAAFLHAVKEQACVDFGGLPPVTETAFYNSLNCGSVEGTGGAASLWLPNPMIQSVCRSVSQNEGPIGRPTNGVIGSLSRVNHNFEVKDSGIQALLPMDNERNFLERPQDMVAYDMSISTLYLHQIHRRRCTANNYVDNVEGYSPAYHGSPNVAFDIGVNGESYPPQSNFPESYYNSSDPPSVDESINASPNALPYVTPSQRNDVVSQWEENPNTPFVHNPKT